MEKPLFSWMHPGTKVGGSPMVEGQRGILARVPIAAGEIIMVMGGPVVDVPTHNRIGAFGEEYGMDISEEFSFCPSNEEELRRMPQFFLNHSCSPNAGFFDQMQIAAIRNIRAGEEITYDYAFVLFNHPENHFQFSIYCRCGQPQCRCKITCDDWKIPALHEKYGPWFQPFLKRRFLALQNSAVPAREVA